MSCLDLFVRASNFGLLLFTKYVAMELIIGISRLVISRARDLLPFSPSRATKRKNRIIESEENDSRYCCTNEYEIAASQTKQRDQSRK